MSATFTYSLNQTSHAAQFVWQHISKKIIAFSGPMGAGKTTLIQALCKDRGVSDDVSSPTFSLVNEYQTASGERIFHFDFYRINSIEEVYDMGYEDYFYSGNVCLIEWPERVESLLYPDEVQSIRIEVLPDGIRKLTIA